MAGRGIAVLGGSFDPVHNGHVALAQAALANLPIEKLLIIPAKLPPHKADYLTSEEHRLNMLELAFADVPLSHIDQRELEQERTSYSLLSVQALRREIGPQTPLCFIMGWDSVAMLATWWRWRELFDYINIAVALRPGFSGFESADVQREFDSRLVALDNLCEQANGKIAMLPFDDVDISSSEIREAIRNSQLVSGQKTPTAAEALTTILPSSVAKYIEQHGLYC